MMRLLTSAVLLSTFLIACSAQNTDDLSVTISPKRAKTKTAVTITCLRRRSFMAGTTLEIIRQVGNLRLRVGIEQVLDTAFKPSGMRLVKIQAQFQQGYDQYILSISSAVYDDTARFICKISNTTASEQLTVCDEPNTEACNCVEREGYPIPKCFKSDNKEVKQYRATVIALAVLFVIVVIYAVIVSILFARDFIAETRAKAHKKLQDRQRHEEQASLDNRGFDDSVTDEHAHIVAALLKEKDLEAKVHDVNMGHVYNVDRAKDYYDEVDASHRSTPEGQSSTGSFNGHDNRNLSGAGALSSKDASLSPAEYAAKYGARPKTKRAPQPPGQHEPYQHKKLSSRPPPASQHAARGADSYPQTNPMYKHQMQTPEVQHARSDRAGQYASRGTDRAGQHASNGADRAAQHTVHGTDRAAQHAAHGTDRAAPAHGLKAKDYYDKARNLSASQTNLAASQTNLSVVSADVHHRARENSQERDNHRQTSQVPSAQGQTSQVPAGQGQTSQVPSAQGQTSQVPSGQGQQQAKHFKHTQQPYSGMVSSRQASTPVQPNENDTVI